MAYIPNHLVSNEQLLYHSRFHWWMWGRTCFPLTLVLILLALVLTLLVDPALGGFAALVSLILPLILGLLPFLGWQFSEIGVTTRRIITKRGIIIRKISEIPMNEIESSQISETLMGRVFGFRRILIEETDGPKHTFDLIRQGEDFHEQVVEQISLSRTWHEQYLNTKRPQAPYNRPPANYTLPSAQAQLMAQAIQLIQQNQKQRAKAVIKQILEQDERNADAWYLMGLTLAEPTRRRAAFVKALRYNPNHVQARQALGD